VIPRAYLAVANPDRPNPYAAMPSRKNCLAGALATGGYWLRTVTDFRVMGQLTESTVNQGAANGQNWTFSARRVAHPAQLRAAGICQPE
jgi:hypothetical protein